MKRREERHQGLGETSKDFFALEEEEDASRRQILMEKRQGTMARKDYPEPAAPTQEFHSRPIRTADPARGRKNNQPDDLDDLDDLMGGDSKPAAADDDIDFFGA